MWKCILGKRKIGKSIYVEKIIKKREGTVLYITTLPELKKYENTIQTHKMRRPDSWAVIDLFKMSIEDILSFPYHNYANIMLDNFSYYLLYNLYFNEWGYISLIETDICRIIDNISIDAKMMVYFVDTPIDLKMLDKYGQQVVFCLYNHIFKCSSTIEWFEREEVQIPLSLNETKKIFYIF